MNIMRLPLTDVLIAIACTSALMYMLRAFPFILFRKKQPPAVFTFIEKYIPAMVIAVLLVYCLKDTDFTAAPYGMSSTIALAATILIHLIFNNSMISIFGGTILYMILDYAL